ncbi:DUF3383 domain-containing protein [Azospirillum argentinense]
MANTLPVSKLISVGVQITPTAAQGPDLNSLLIVGDTPGVIDARERYRLYSGLNSVAGDFGTSAPEYQAASIFFAAQPQPTRLYIGYWVREDAPARLVGATLPAAQQVMSNWTAITSGAFLTYIDSIPHNISGLNFSTATNLNGVASAIQTALNSAASGSAAAWDSVYGRFDFASGTDGADSSFSFLQAPAAIGSAAFSGQPANNDTLTIKGTAVTFVSGAPSAGQVQIGATLAATLANLLTFLSNSADANLSAMTYGVVGTTLYIVSKATGTAGASYTLAKSGTNITVSGATLSGGSGTDISATLGARVTTSGSCAVPGADAETPLAAVQAIESVFADWYGLTFGSSGGNAHVTDADHLAVAGYIEGNGNRRLYGVTTSEAAALLPGDTTSIGALIRALGYDRTFYQWSSTKPYAICAMFGEGCTVNYNGANTTITFMWKQQPGVVAESLNSTQAAALDANNYNYYANFNNNTAITVNGKLASGHFIDEIWNADWFGSSIQSAVFNLLFTTPTKVPQTDAGMHLIGTTIEAVCAQAVNNGFLAPGVWNSAGFGQYQQGDWLPKGYYVYVPPIASQSQADRAARKSVPIQVMAKEAGAVHDVAISVTVNQ